MKVIKFALYYLKLRLSVLLGIHQTANPLSIAWRWNHWNHQYHLRRH